MKRKMFLQKVAGAFLLAIPAYALINCSTSGGDGPSGGNTNNGNNDPYGGDGNPNPSTGANCLQYGTNVQIGGNHGHTLTVSIADINAGVDKTYNIMGSADHDHQVTVTAADFATLKNNLSVGENSTTVASHSHSITISCAT